MKERQSQRQPIPRLSEQRSIDGWENLRSLGKRFGRAEQVEVINERLEEQQRVWSDEADGLP